MYDLPIDSPTVRSAYGIMHVVHLDQKDKGGNPYENHPLAIASVMDTEDEVCVALLHDVLEDTSHPNNFRDLLQSTFSKNICDAVEALTRPTGVTYNAYINTLKRNPLAAKVKLADLAHNLNRDRIPASKQMQYLSLMKRYETAANIILTHYMVRNPDLWRHWQKCYQTFRSTDDNGETSSTI